MYTIIKQSLAGTLNVIHNLLANRPHNQTTRLADPSLEHKKASNRLQLKPPTVQLSKDILDAFRQNVGCLAPETGGLLGSTTDEAVVDLYYFDEFSKNTPGSFYYDVQTLSKVFQDWKSEGYVTNGICHSHPTSYIRPSYHDISTALMLLRFFQLDYFYLPILQPKKNGLFTLFFYVVQVEEDNTLVTLDHVLKATADGYKLVPFRPWREIYAVAELDAYQASVAAEEANESAAPSDTTSEDTDLYFTKVKSLYPDHVLDKVIVCIGTGGARSFLENCARCGFRNYILMDKDIVSPSNVATQAVFISEMGKKKVEVLRDRILDINPCAQVLCVDQFLDDSMSDALFKSYLDHFPNRKPTDYLILGCTDSFEAQKRSSMLALKYGTPYLAAMMYDGGAAAELLFLYPGISECCPRCVLRSRFEAYESGFRNDVDSFACPIFATERMNATKGYLALMLLMYHEAPGSPFHTMLDEVKDRNFVWIRLRPDLKDTSIGIDLFDRVFASDAKRFTYFDETLWIPQKPDRPEFGSEPCKLCGGTGDLTHLSVDWADQDTRSIQFDQ